MHSVLVTEHSYNRQMYARCTVGTLQYNVTIRYIEQTQRAYHTTQENVCEKQNFAGDSEDDGNISLYSLLP